MKLKVIVSLLLIVAIHKTNAQPSCQSLFSNIVRVADNVLTKISTLEQSAADALGPYIISATTAVPARFTSTPQVNVLSATWQQQPLMFKMKYSVQSVK